MDCAKLQNGCRQCRSELEKRLKEFPDVFQYIVRLEKEKDSFKKKVEELEKTLEKKEDEEKELTRRISMGARASKII